MEQLELDKSIKTALDLSTELLNICMEKSTPGESLVALTSIVASILCSQEDTKEGRDHSLEVLIKAIRNSMEKMEPVLKMARALRAEGKSEDVAAQMAMASIPNAKTTIH